MNRFSTKTLADQLEEFEDREDLQRILCEPTRPLSEILEELKLTHAVGQKTRVSIDYNDR